MPLEPLLAHQGGWDEFLMVATPIGLFVLLLRAAKRRALDEDDAVSDGTGGPDEDAPSEP